MVVLDFVEILLQLMQTIDIYEIVRSNKVFTAYWLDLQTCCNTDL